QADVCLLEQGIRGDQQAHGPGRAREVAAALEQRGLLLEQREIVEPELLARADRPVLVAVVGQETVPMKLDRFRIGIGAAGAARTVGGRTELVDVDPETLRREGDELAG